MKRLSLSILAMFMAGGVAGAAEPPGQASLDLGEGLKLELVLIPAGTFMMGSPGDEDGVKSNRPESPRHAVTISRAFYMGTYLVTQEQWAAVMGKWRLNKKLGIGPKHPAHSFHWRHGVSFCTKLSERTGRTVRLPTEAEWEYACRAGMKTAVDPKGPASGWYTNRVMRGGAFDVPARDCRSGRRGLMRDAHARPGFGMRVVVEEAADTE